MPSPGGMGFCKSGIWCKQQHSGREIFSTGSASATIHASHEAAGEHDLADHSARTRKRDGCLSRRHRRPASGLHSAGGRISRPALAGSRRICRRRYLFRYFRLPDHPHHSHADQGPHFLIGGILLAPDSADISGAPRCAGRYLPDRLVCTSTGRVRFARREHCGGRCICIQSFSTRAGRLFRAGRSRKSAAPPLVVRHRGTILHFLAAHPLDDVWIAEARILDGRHRDRVVLRQP
jgi:hypothetical protein